MLPAIKRIAGLGFLALASCLTVWGQQGSGVPVPPLLPADGTGDSNGGGIFIGFSATVKNINKVWLQWDADSVGEGDYFVVERSSEGGRYETIGVLRKEGGEGGDHYEMMDMAPPNGADLYRIRFAGQQGRVAYSKTVPLSLSGEVEFKFYPNPVDKLFIIRTEHAVDIQVLDNNGAIRLSKRLQAGIQVVNISSLEKGNYILRVADKESNRIVSSQLIKN